MPQILFEYTSNVDKGVEFKPLILDIHKSLVSHCSVSIENCKTRVHCLDEYLIGSGNSENKFIHIEIKLYEGRSQKILSALGESLIEMVTKFWTKKTEASPIDITVHIVDINKSRYYKNSI